ncbi:hypothetical protein [Flavobacterium sp. 3HN19-14]|uniref:hypothetical protein n=1 Tax=Flavobacterium sp. 3HN19-14 TaxID=3448133 RepID=UPI003EDFA3D3
MRQLFFRLRFHMLLVVFALLWLNIFDFISQMSIQGVIYPDCSSYLSAAKSLYQLHIGNQYRPMGIAAIIGFPLLFGFSDDAVFEFGYFVNVICWIGTTLIIFEIARTFLKQQYAFIPALISIFFIGNTALVFQLMSENIFMFTIAIFFFLLTKYFTTKAFSYLSAALALAIFAILIKPGMFFLAIIFCLFFIRELFQNRKAKSTLLLYFSTALVLVQCAGLRYQFGNFTVSYIDAVTYYNYLGSKSWCLKNNVKFDQQNNRRHDYMFSFEPKMQKQIAASDMKSQLQNNTIPLLKSYVDDVKGNMVSGSAYIEVSKDVRGANYFEDSKKILLAISKWQNIIFTVLGTITGLWFLFKGDKKLRIMAIFVLYIYTSSGISCDQGDRFHVITFPFVLLLAANFLVKFQNINPK